MHFSRFFRTEILRIFILFSFSNWNVLAEDSVSRKISDENHSNSRLPGPSIFEYRHKPLETSSRNANDAIPAASSHSSHNPDSPKVKRNKTKENKDATPPHSHSKSSFTSIQKNHNSNHNQIHQNENPNHKNQKNASSQLNPYTPGSEPEHPRYYEMAGDELYVFEPSPMGARPFMEAILEDEGIPQHFPGNNLPPFPPYIHFPIEENQISHSSSDSFNYNDNDNDNEVYNDHDDQTDHSDSGEYDCMSANEKQGRCTSFRTCYPVVFDALSRQLKNAGLARMLYQASGPCGENAGLEIEIPPDFYNRTVCCPGYFYFEGTIPHPHPSPQPKLKPSKVDPMLSPDTTAPRFLPPRSNKNKKVKVKGQDKGHELSRSPLHSNLPPPPIVLRPFDMFDHAPPDYYEDDLDTDFESLKTPQTTSTTTTTKKPLTRIKKVKRVRVKAGSGRHFNATSQDSSESKQKEVKVRSKGEPSATAQRSANSTSSTTGQLRTHKVKSEAAIPLIVDPPHLSAWNCPGRQIGMPRGYWPWMVALLNEGSHFCSGSLIDKRHILTSASCVASFQGKDMGKMRAILGDRVLYSSVDGPHVWRKIVRITRHLQFDPETMEHDIAVLEMDSAVSFSPTIQPINLPSSSLRGHTSKAIVSGWSGSDLGKRFFTARPTVDTVVEFLPSSDCQKQYEGFKPITMSSLLCTRPSATACKADLGSPLMMKTGNCWHAIGILSHGLGCGMFPEIFTDTASHIHWIQKNLRHHFTPEETFIKP